MADLALDTLTAETLTPLIGDGFSLMAASTFGYPVRLDRVERGKVSAAARQSFSAFFVGTPGQVLPQQIYRLEHRSGAALELFLVPIGTDGENTVYQAVFN
jgi:hypothetical protein